MTRSHFIRLAGGGLLLAAAIQLFFASGLYVWMAIPGQNLTPLNVIAAAALVAGLVGLFVAWGEGLGRLGRVCFAIALTGTVSSLVGTITGWTGFSFVAVFIGLWLPRDPQVHNGLGALDHLVQVGIWVTWLCVCAGLVLYGAAILRTRRVARWGAAALIAIGLLQFPFALLTAPFPFVRATPVYALLLSDAIYYTLRLAYVLIALLWGVVGVALLVAPRAGDADTPMPRPAPA